GPGCALPPEGPAGGTLMHRLLGLLLVLGLVTVSQASARASERREAEPLRFAVLAGLPAGDDESPRMHRLQEAFEQEHLDFLIQLGPLQNRRTACSDNALYARKLALDTLPLPVVLVPDESLWAECPRVRGRTTDPLEQLERVREIFYAEDASLGQQ